jgi:parvulin-like peptidyl-prolyl isomerase
MEENKDNLTGGADDFAAAHSSEGPQSDIKTEVIPSSAIPPTVSSVPRTVPMKAAQSKETSAMAKALGVLVVILLIGVGLVIWKAKMGGGLSRGSTGEALTHLTNDDMQILLKDANPMMLKQLSENPEAKQQQVKNLKQLLAVASQARKEGLADDPETKKELEDIRTEITATLYDHEKNKDKGPMPPFGFIDKAAVDAYYQQPGKEDEFRQFIDSKVAEAKKDGRLPADKEPSEEELSQAKDFYAKVRIYADEEKTEGPKLGADFQRKLDLQLGLQEAQTLVRKYAEKTLNDKLKVSDEDVQNYIKAHPELDPATKKAKADEILARAKGGEDFAKLADQYTEDPGNEDPKTKEKKGGLYKDITAGAFVPEFEKAALSLEPGQIYSEPVQTKYGYHIIKLEKKGTAKGKDGKDSPSYDVRHILISTMMTDPTNPTAPPMPVEDKIKSQLEEEKETAVLKEIEDNNPIVIDDFEVPAPTAEQLEQMQRKQQQQLPMMQPGDGPPDTGSAPGAGKKTADANKKAPETTQKAPDTKKAPVIKK